MDYRFSTELKDGYLHVRVFGPNDVPTTRRYVEDVIAACTREDCPNVLIEENLEGERLSLGEIFGVLSEKDREIRAAIQLSAFVDVNPRRILSNQVFAEDVAVNRGIPIRYFATVPQAEQWLREKLGHSAR